MILLCSTCCFFSQRIEDFVLWFLFTAPIQEISEPYYNVKSYRHGPLPLRFLKLPEEWYNSVSPTTWSCDTDTKTRNLVRLQLYSSVLALQHNLESKYSLLTKLHAISYILVWDLLTGFGGDIHIEMLTAEAWHLSLHSDL